MRRSFFYLFVLFSLVISACGMPASEVAQLSRVENTTEGQAAPSTAEMRLSEIPLTFSPTAGLVSEPTLTPSPSPTHTPSPSPTATPRPKKIVSDTLAELQVMRFATNFLEDGKIYHRFLSPDTRLIAESGCRNNDIDVCFHPVFRLVDVDSGEVLRELDRLVSYVHIAKFSPDGTILAAAGCNIDLYLVGEPDTLCTAPRLWLIDTASGKMTFELGKYNSTIRSLLFSADGQKLYVGVRYFKKTSENDSSVRVWEVKSGKLVDEFQPDIVNCMDVTLQFAPGERFLVTRYSSPCTGESYVKWWDMQQRAVRPHGGGQGVQYALSADGSRIAVQESLNNVAILVYDLLSAERLAYLPGLGSFGDRIQFDFLQNNQTLLVSRYDWLKVFDLSQGKVIKEIPRSKDSPSSYVRLSPDRSLLLTGATHEKSSSFNMMGSLWDTTTWQETRLKAVRMQAIYNAAGQFSTDQQRIVFVDTYTTAVWGLPDIEQESALATLLAYQDLLVKGKYALAAQKLVLDDEYYYTGVLAEMVPEAAPGDLAGVLSTLCQDERFPCLPVREVLLRSQVAEDRYLFVVNFNQLDGTPAVWPLCVGVPEAKSCFRRDGLFEYEVVRQANGEFIIRNSLPPGIDLRPEP